VDITVQERKSFTKWVY